MAYSTTGNSLQTNKKVQLFAAMLSDDVNYLKESVKAIPESELKGKKFGQSFTFYLPSNPIATVGQSLDITNSTKDIFEIPLYGSMSNANCPVNYDSWEEMTRIEDFAKTILAPMADVLGAGITQYAINACAFASDGAIVVGKDANGDSLISANTFIGLASRARSVRAGAKLTAFAHPQIIGNASAKALGLFNAPEIAKELYGNAALGDIASSTVVTENYMPVIEVGSLPAVTAVSLVDGVATVTGTNLVEGAAFNVANASGVFFHPTDLISKPIMLEKRAFIVTNVNAAGTSGTVTGHIRFQTKAGVAQVSATVTGEENDFTTGSVWTSLLSADKVYAVIQVRTGDQVNFTPTTFPAAKGCATETQRVGSYSANYTAWTNPNTLATLARMDVPMLVCPTQSRLSRLAYVEI